MVKLIDYGSDSESDGENSQEMTISKQTPIQSAQEAVASKKRNKRSKVVNKQNNTKKMKNEQEIKEESDAKIQRPSKFLKSYNPQNKITQMDGNQSLWLKQNLKENAEQLTFQKIMRKRVNL